MQPTTMSPSPERPRAVDREQKRGSRQHGRRVRRSERGNELSSTIEDRATFQEIKKLRREKKFHGVVAEQSPWLRPIAHASQDRPDVRRRRLVPSRLENGDVLIRFARIAMLSRPLPLQIGTSETQASIFEHPTHGLVGVCNCPSFGLTATIHPIPKIIFE